MRLILFISFVFFSPFLFGQNQYINFVNDGSNSNSINVNRIVNDFGTDGLKVRYDFSSAIVHNQLWRSSFYNYFYIKGFSQLQELGKPMLPVHTDLIFIPEGASINITISKLTSTIYNNFNILPAQTEATDLSSNNNKTSYYDSVLYYSNSLFPSEAVQLKKILEIRGQHFAVVEVYPMQINPFQEQLSLHSTIEYSVSFSSVPRFINYSNYSYNFLKHIPNMVINKPKLQNSINSYIMNNKPDMQIGNTNYVIVCPQEFIKAADTLAKWKSQLGYKVKILQDINISTVSLKNKLRMIYNDSLSNLEYVLILGDYEQVPSKSVFVNGKDVYTDNYYACFGDSNDVFPDVAIGRISVHSLASAFNTVNKIIEYEKHPSFNMAFYQNASLISSYEEDINGFEEKNYIFTTERIRNKLQLKGVQARRLYTCDIGINPTKYNNTIYSSGGVLDNSLSRPTYAWNVNANGINQALNSPNIFVMYRSASYYGGFSKPKYNLNNLSQLHNTSLPIIFDLSGKSGDFREYNCMGESFLSKLNNGAIAVFSNGSDITSGMNNALAYCLTDAIWPNIGIISDIQTSYTGINNVQNIPIQRLGYVKNQALCKIPEVWGSNEAQKNEVLQSLNLFGDPAMRILTSVPQTITASTTDTLYCSLDNHLIINSNTEGVATLVVNDSLVSAKYIRQGVDTLLFDQLTGTKAVLTISRDNYKPFIKKIHIAGNCFGAKIRLDFIDNCINDSIHVLNVSPNNVAANYSWNFGLDAIPQTASGNGPFDITYSSGGTKTIQLTMSVGSQQRTFYKTLIIDDVCLKHIPTSGHYTSNACSGTLTDNGKLDDYTNNVMGSFTISPNNASQVSINFTQFDMVGNNDIVNIYDGPNTNANLLISLSENNVPTTSIISSGSSVTIEQQTDAETTAAGFVLNWNCISSNSLPQAEFECIDSISCNSILKFYDLSSGGVSQWRWDFGDGSVSYAQHPVHKYMANGVYNVKLLVTNSFGSDSIIKINYVNINMPPIPIVSDEIRCKEGSIQFNNQSNNTVFWYKGNNGVLLDTGVVFNTPIIDTTTYFSASTFVNSQPQTFGVLTPHSNTYYRYNSEIEGLVFNVYKNIILVSVDVYSQAQNSVTFYLFNSAGIIINSKNWSLVAGKNTINLNWSLLKGVSYELAVSKGSNLLCQNGGNFPYSIDNMISIKSVSANLNNNEYFYFFNWNVVDLQGCLSKKVDIVAVVSDTLGAESLFNFQKIVNRVDFENLSLYADTYYWDFGDGDFSLQSNPNHIYHNAGLYNVSLIATNDCGQSIYSKTIQINNTSLQNISAFKSINIFPNPASDILNIEIELLNSAEVNIRLLDVVGKTIVSNILRSYGQKIEEQIDVSNISSGVYYLVLTTESDYTVKKVIINRN